MTDATIATLNQWAHKEVTLKGWVGHKRKSGKIRFMTLRDGTGIVQLVFAAEEMPEADWAVYPTLKQESSVIVNGIVREEPRAPGGFELLVKHIQPVHIPVDEFPISHKAHGADFLLGQRHLWLRSRRQVAIMRVRHAITSAMRAYFDADGFIETPTPILTPSACEGTTTLFPVPYFDLGEVYLSQSGQLYAEATAMAAGKVYTFSPAFRAEKSKTRKHLTEFWMVEPEMAWFDFEMNLNLIEGLIRHVLTTVLEKCRPDLTLLERDIQKLSRAAAPFKRMTYREAITWLNERGRALKFGDDFGAEDETLIGQSHEVPVFITHYPADHSAFYMKVDEADPSVVRNCDLIAPEGYGELVGGSQREENIDALKQRIKAHRLNQEDFEWYLDLRRFGSVPHSGFGVGIERTVAWICGVEHVRECIAFPRMIYRVRP